MNVPSKLKPLFLDPHVHNIIQGGRGGAKTRTIPQLIVDVMSECPLSIIAAREVQKSLKESSHRAITNEIYRQKKGHLFEVTRDTIFSKAGGRITFIGLLNHTADSIKSYEDYHWVWIEEAQSVSKQSLDILIPTLRTDGWFKHGEFKFPLRMFIYTMNPFSWDDPIKLVLPESREDTQYITINWYDNPWFPESLNKERLEAKETMSKEEYDRIWEGIPYDSTESGIFTRDAVDDAMSRDVKEGEDIVVASDIARFGTDKTIFMKRRGFKVTEIKEYSKLDTQEIARRLNDFAEGGKILLDDTGVGGGVTDKLNDLKSGGRNNFNSLVPINFGASAEDKEKYPDIISEMWFNLKDKIEEIGIPKNERLKTELISRNFEYLPDERRKVESKKNYKRRTGLSSPDYADTLIMLFYSGKQWLPWSVV